MKKGIWSVGTALLLSVMMFTAGCGNKESLTDTERWTNASYAVLTKTNNGDVTQLGGYPKTKKYEEAAITQLENTWKVTDKETLLSTVNGLQNERPSNAELIAWLQSEGLIIMNKEERAAKIASYTAEKQQKYLTMFVAYDNYDNNAIVAWDLSRANSVAGMGYIANYITREEYDEITKEVSIKLQSAFDSWDNMFDSYILGYAYTLGESIDDESGEAYKRKQYYDELKAQPDGPFSIAWDTVLS